MFASARRTAMPAVKWVNDYSSAHHILLVGEGDFSFSQSLATSFGSASKIVATSLDSEDDLTTKYNGAIENVNLIRKLGATVLHRVDATVMAADSRLTLRKFDRIVFNFPHAGFFGWRETEHRFIELHRELVRKFFCNANRMLRSGGEIHVRHKTVNPFNQWGIEELADLSDLKLKETIAFNKLDYLRYLNKKGDGPNCNRTFPIGESVTYKFILTPQKKAFKKKKKKKE